MVLDPELTIVNYYNYSTLPLRTKATLSITKANERCYVPVILYLPTGRGCSLPVLELKTS